MSDDQPPSRTAPRKRWVERISQLFSGEPHDLDDLLDILREAREPIIGYRCLIHD